MASRNSAAGSAPSTRVNFYIFTAIFPWFAMARNWVSIFAHIVFGIVSAWAYKKLQTPVTAAATSRPQDLAAR